MLKEQKILFGFILLYLSAYYGWLFIYYSSSFFTSIGGNLFSIVGLLISLYYLGLAIKRAHPDHFRFWLVIGIGVFFYLIAELIWLISENVFSVDITYPGLPDVFYILQILCILSALIYKIIKETAMGERISFLFDTLIILVVASTFSWKFIITPILETNIATFSTLFVSLIYPIGDLAMLVAAVFLIFNVSNQSKSKSISLLIFAVTLQAIADSLYLYLISKNAYLPGNWIDPLFILSMLIISFVGLGHSNHQKIHVSTNRMEQLNLFQMLLPYASVVALFTFMIFHSDTFDIVTFGCAISILLVIIRQVFVILENRKLVKKYYCQAQALELSEKKYRSLFEYHPDPVYSTDRNGKFTSSNDACNELLKMTANNLLGQNSLNFVEDTYQKKVTKELKEVFKGKPRNYETVIQASDGTSTFMNITNVPIIVQNEVIGIYGIGKDITDIKLNEQKIHYLAYHDALTGLFNRSAFDECLSSLINNTRDHSSPTVTLFFMDLNQFKLVNDTFGHAIGDQLLKAVASRLQIFEKDFEMIARRGGDEFTLLLKDSTTVTEVKELANQILSELQSMYQIDEHLIFCPPSIGISCYSIDAFSIVDLMKHADVAMYYAKSNLKGSYIFYNELKPTLN